MKYLCTLILLITMPVAAAQAASLYSSVKNGVDLFEQEKYEQALETFLEAQVDNPESEVLKFDIASCQYRLQKYDEAAAGYLDVVATARDAGLEAQALYNLGNTMYRQGKLEDAVEYYKKTLELNPEDEDARKNLEFVREEIKRRINEARDTQKRQQQQQEGEQQDQKDGEKDGQQGQKDNKQDQQDQQGQQQGQQDAQQDEGQGAQQDSGQEESQQPQPDGQQEDQEQQAQGSSDKQQQQEMQAPAGQSAQQDGSRSGQEDVGDIRDGGRPMSDEEAEQWLRGLEENPEKLQEYRRRSLPGQPRRPERDW